MQPQSSKYVQKFALDALKSANDMTMTIAYSVPGLAENVSKVAEITSTGKPKKLSRYNDMEEKNSNEFRTFFDIDPDWVLEEARQNGLQVNSFKDFREVDDYGEIENLMNQYIAIYARYSAIGGSTSGIGGFATSITLGGLEILSSAIQLYRLSQRFAVLNGFDPENPLHKDKARSIYLDAIGFKAATETAVKLTLLGSSIISQDWMLVNKLVSAIKRLSNQGNASQRLPYFIPLVGGAVGAYSSYSYAYDTGNSMRDAFKEFYQEEWQ